jgi:hypothetical protein
MIVECYAVYVGGIVIDGQMALGFPGETAIKKKVDIPGLQILSVGEGRFMLRHARMEKVLLALHLLEHE